jgi:16S rRNA (guanine966-N2)-methyltransferase
VRVAGGELRGRRLAVPKGSAVRPTTERVREAVFSILGDITGLRVLDLFCGSGALGIEAVSRGAAEATLVDTQPATAQRNVDELGLGERIEVVRADARRFLGREPEREYDLVLCDPPYKLADLLAADLDPLIQSHLAEGGRVIFETSPESPVSMTLPLSLERRYGDSLIRVYADGGEAS